MFGDDAHELAGVGCADRFALVDDAGQTSQQRSVANVRVAHHPAQVRCSPPTLARLYIVDRLHGPLERHAVATRRPLDALRVTYPTVGKSKSRKESHQDAEDLPTNELEFSRSFFSEPVHRFPNKTIPFE